MRKHASCSTRRTAARSCRRRRRSPQAGCGADAGCRTAGPRTVGRRCQTSESAARAHACTKRCAQHRGIAPARQRADERQPAAGGPRSDPACARNRRRGATVSLDTRLTASSAEAEALNQMMRFREGIDRADAALQIWHRMGDTPNNGISNLYASIALASEAIGRDRVRGRRLPAGDHGERALLRQAQRAERVECRHLRHVPDCAGAARGSGAVCDAGARPAPSSVRRRRRSHAVCHRRHRQAALRATPV